MDALGRHRHARAPRVQRQVHDASGQIGGQHGGASPPLEEEHLRLGIAGPPQAQGHALPVGGDRQVLGQVLRSADRAALRVLEEPRPARTVEDLEPDGDALGGLPPGHRVGLAPGGDRGPHGHLTGRAGVLRGEQPGSPGFPQHPQAIVDPHEERAAVRRQRQGVGGRRQDLPVQDAPQGVDQQELLLRGQRHPLPIGGDRQVPQEGGGQPDPGGERAGMRVQPVDPGLAASEVVAGDHQSAAVLGELQVARPRTLEARVMGPDRREARPAGRGQGVVP